MLLLTSLLVAAGPADDCSEQPRSDLRDALQRVDAAYEQMDGDGLDAAMNDLRGALAAQCVPAESRLAARVHRAFGLHAWTLFDTDTSVRAFLAMRANAERWPGELEASVPEDHPVREVWGSQRDWTVALDEQPPGGWLVDGMPTSEVPRDRAFVLQARSRDGGVTWTGWLTAPSEVPLSPWRRERIRKIQRRGTWVTLGVATVGAGLFTAGLIQRGRIDDVPASRRRELQNQSNALQAAGIGTMVVSGAGLGLLWGIKW